MSKKSSSFIFSSKGAITFKILLGVVIIGSIALVSGVFPKGQITPQDPNAPRYKVKADDETLQKKSIQLKTLKFETCSESVAVEMVLDRSGSMRTGTKMKNLKTASLFFINKLTDQAPIGIITFSNTVREEFEIQPYGQIKGNINSVIQGLTPNGFTHTREALQRTKTSLEVGMPQYPGRQFAVIFVSDGVPETQRGGSFDPTQDPTTAPNIADEIKNLGVRIYTIAITQGLSGNNRQQMNRLMQGVASPDSFFEAPDTSQLETIYNQIGFEICNEAK
jgi:uncharacterized protein YegL